MVWQRLRLLLEEGQQPPLCPPGQLHSGVIRGEPDPGHRSLRQTPLGLALGHLLHIKLN